MDKEAVLRKQLVALLHGGQAHMTFDDAVKDFPMSHINTYPPNVTYTPWHLIEHIRITQWDILDFIRNPSYKEMEWPKSYWPDPKSKATPEQWQTTIHGYHKDLKDMEAIADNPNTDLYSPIAHGDGQTILREIMLVADHTAYHTGELGILRQVILAWPDQR